MGLENEHLLIFGCDSDPKGRLETYQQGKSHHNRLIENLSKRRGFRKRSAGHKNLNPSCAQKSLFDLQKSDGVNLKN